MPSDKTKITSKDKKVILETARHAIQYGLTYTKAPQLELNNYSEELKVPRATFVTLKETNRLRGCIGCLSATQPLIQNVADNAFAAAFKDPRFPPVNKLEEPLLHISVSILSEPKPLAVDSEQDLIKKLNAGEDGVILKYRHQQATFLPSVWQELDDKQIFINHLKEKAGLERDFWSPEIQISIYHSESID